MIDFLKTFPDIDVRFFHKGDDLSYPEYSCRVNQVHGSRTIRVEQPTGGTEKADLSAEALAQADGMVTDVANLPLVIRIADCQSFVVYEPRKRVLGALHAGWRGLVAGAIEEWFKALKNEYDINPENVWIAAGPSLCQTCAEFTDPKKELPGIDPRFFDGRLVDLRGVADAKLHALGVLSDRIERHPDCTRCHPEKYWSYRGEKDAVLSGNHNLMVCSMV